MSAETTMRAGADAEAPVLHMDKARLRRLVGLRREITRTKRRIAAAETRLRAAADDAEATELAAALRDNAAWEVQLALYDSGDGSITLTYADPVRLHSLWVYGTPDAARLPETVTAVVNDTFVTDAAAFSAADAMRPVVLHFGALPADVRVQKLELRFTGGDVALGELCSIVRR